MISSGWLNGKKRIEMRCFIGSFVHSGLSARLVDHRPDIPNVRWVKPERNHITLKFFADLSSDRVDSLLDSVEKMRPSFPIECQTTFIDGFPSVRKARVIVVRVDSGGLLESLASEKNFKSHITIGYARNRPISFERIPLELEFTLDTVVLVESKNGQYRIVERTRSVHS